MAQHLYQKIYSYSAIQKFPLLLRIPKIHFPVSQSPLLDPTLTHLIHSRTFHTCSFLNPFEQQSSQLRLGLPCGLYCGEILVFLMHAASAILKLCVLGSHLSFFSTHRSPIVVEKQALLRSPHKCTFTITYILLLY
jgi:hypothetical protein